MNPDFDDYESFVAEREQEPRPRPWPKLILGLAVVGFLMLAWYAYNSGTQSVNQETLPLITADSTPIREVPEDRGGEEFPNKDKTIYDAISPYSAEPASKVEKLLPEPEEPVKPEGMAAVKDEPSTWVKKNEDEEAIAAAIAEEDSDPAERKVNAMTQEVAKTVELPIEDPVVKREMASAMLKELVKEEQKPAATPVAAPVTQTQTQTQTQVLKPVTNGAYKVQLGAYKSDGEARAEWQKIAQKHGEVLGNRPHMVIRADLDKGTFYRLRVGGYDSPAVAKAACAALTQRKQACMYVGK
jgi:hypothetical protein